MKFVMQHPKEKGRRVILDRQELIIAKVIFGQLPLIRVYLETGMDYNIKRRKHKTDWVSAIVAAIILGVLTMFIGYCIMMRAIL